MKFDFSEGNRMPPPHQPEPGCAKPISPTPWSLMQLLPCRRVLCRAFSSPVRCGKMQRRDLASIILTAVTAILFVHFFKASVLEGYGFTKQSWCSQWYNCPDIAMPAALGTVEIRGSAGEGKLGRNVCDAGRINPQGTALCKLAGEVSLWRPPRCVHRGQWKPAEIHSVKLSQWEHFQKTGALSLSSELLNTPPSSKRKQMKNGHSLNTGLPGMSISSLKIRTTVFSHLKQFLSFLFFFSV